MPQPDCPHCEGIGFQLTGEGTASTVKRCSCCTREPGEADLLALGMPRRYLHCTLENYRPGTPAQVNALRVAQSFVENYPAIDGGILFNGPCGTGKTHLSAAITRALVMDQGISAAFADYQDLLKRIQATWNKGGDTGARGQSEDDVLAPVLEAELLVLDDLGARRTTPWAEETISHLLNVRYNEQRATIITTNLLNLQGREDSPGSLPGGKMLLSDRVNERVLSRLHEMCRTVDVEGEDYRRRD